MRTRLDLLRALREEAMRLGCTALVDRIDELVNEVQAEVEARRARRITRPVQTIEARINGVDVICVPKP